MDDACRTLPDLFWAYTSVWAILAAYLFYLGQRISRLEKKPGKDA